jgi:hypothetical protein
VYVTGTQFPEDAECPKCHSIIGLVPPLGNVVGMAILGRAASEFQTEDWTMAIVLGAIAVECDMAYLFMKWNRVELLATRDPNEADEEAWEQNWRKLSTISRRLDEVSRLLSGKPFDLFISQNPALVQPIGERYPHYGSERSPKQFFIKELFHKRNRIVHFGEINFQRADADMCLMLARTLSQQILSALDEVSRSALDAKQRSKASRASKRA